MIKFNSQNYKDELYPISEKDIENILFVSNVDRRKIFNY